jgi:HlyD family secretion protein
MSTRKWAVIVVVVVVVAGLAYAGYRVWRSISAARQPSAAAQETALVRRGTLRLTVDGTGSVDPRSEVSVGFSSGGKAVKVPVEVGDSVVAGDALVYLDDADARQALAEAQSKAAQASIDLRKARIDAETGIAEANLEAARANYREAAAVAGRVDDQLASARVQLERAQNDLAQARKDYDDAWDPARDWELYVRGRKDALQSERDSTRASLRDAQLSLEDAQAGYDLQVAKVSRGDLLNAEYQVRNQQATLEKRPLDLEQLEDSLKQAQLQVESAQRTLEETTLTAPISGTVTILDAKVGERVGAGASIVTVSDLRALEVKINLDETDIPQVSVGQEGAVTLDAFPNAVLTGTVTAIAPVAEVESGVVLYPVTVRLLPAEVPVRAGMTADVKITTESRQDVLIVPLRAVRSDDGTYYVLRQTPSGFERVDVTLGLTTDTEVQITSGLKEGDVVSVVAPPSQSSQQQGSPGLFGRRSGSGGG